MPLSSPVERKLIHTRNIICKGYLRDDGLIDIEGHLVDTKPFDFPNKDRGGTIKADEALHGMSIRITIDRNLSIKDASFSMDYTPYNYCKNIPPVFHQLIGIKIGPGWRGNVARIMGGIKGCTHLTELLGPIATTAYQALSSANRTDKDNSIQNNRIKPPPKFINSCFSHAEDSPVVKEHWPQSYRENSDQQD